MAFFYTHKIDASNDASTSFFLLFLFFSSFSNCYCSIFAMSDEWTLFVFCSDYREEIFALFFFCSDYPLGISAGFSTKRDLVEKILEKLKFAAATFEPLILITFHH
jgi:hypothetical protein